MLTEKHATTYGTHTERQQAERRREAIRHRKRCSSAVALVAVPLRITQERDRRRASTRKPGMGEGRVGEEKHVTVPFWLFVSQGW